MRLKILEIKIIINTSKNAEISSIQIGKIKIRELC